MSGANIICGYFPSQSCGLTANSNGNLDFDFSGLNNSIAFQNPTNNFFLIGPTSPGITEGGGGLNTGSSTLTFGGLSGLVTIGMAQPVPEPDTSAMLLMSTGVMGFMARRRKNTQA